MKDLTNIFRAFDIRGVYPGEINEEVVSAIARAFLVLYPNLKKVVVSHDTRLSSPILARAICQALKEAGREAVFLGTSPDPLFYFAIFHYGFDGGIMVSGSHNPPEYNGLMIHVKNQGDLIGPALEKIRQLASGGKSPAPKKGGQITSFDPTADYIDYVSQRIHLKKPIKIVVDTGNGAMGFLPQKVFEKLGCEVLTLYGDFDGSFPHHLPDPYERENRLDAKKAVLDQKFDLGFVFDGDGDRVAAIDNRGRSVAGDFCFLMLARQALAKHKGPIVHEVRISQAFLDEMKEKKVKTYFCVSHHAAIIEKIKKVKAIFGGEVTMHFLFPKDHYLCDEAMFAALKLAEIASNQKDLAAYVDALPRYPASPEVFIPCPDEEKFLIVEKLQAYLKENKYDFIDVDGARISFPHGWALIRAANTTPYLKMRFEADTPEHLTEIEEKSLEIFQKAGVPVTEKTYQDLDLIASTIYRASRPL